MWHPRCRLCSTDLRQTFVELVIMPWNLRTEITAQLDHMRGWGSQFVVSLPKLEIF
jgi:hypothetical protein